jgi:hypothetical protein
MPPIFPKDRVAASKTGYRIVASMVQPKSLQIDGDLGEDEITVKYSGTIVTELTDAYDADGDLLSFTKYKPQMVFYANAIIQIDKPATANDVGLNLV